MNLTEARTWVRQFARSASDSSMYPDDAIDRAIQHVGDDFVNRVRCVIQQDTITITANNPVLDFSAVSGFYSRRLDRCWVDLQPPLTIVLHQDILDARRCIQAAPFAPLKIGFVTPTKAEVWPTPTADTTLNYVWFPAFTIFAAGASGATVLNVPDDYMRGILAYGATAMLQHTEPEHKYASESWKQYVEFREASRDRQLGTHVSFRDREVDVRYSENYIEGGISSR